MRSFCGRPISTKRALAFEIRKLMAYEGLPIDLQDVDLRRTTRQGWSASAVFVTRKYRVRTPVCVTSDDSMEECADQNARLTYRLEGVDKLRISIVRD